MHDSNLTVVLVVTAVVLFFLLGVAIMVIMDHKVRLTEGFTNDFFSIAGKRRDHPVEAFVVMTILMGIILSLLFVLFAALTGQLGLFQGEEESELLITLTEERLVEKARHFHNVPKNNVIDMGKKNVCFYCHGDYPHSKEPMIRTLMNMHTQFIGCMTCHADARKIPEDTLTFKWLNFSGIDVKGPAFGTRLDETSGDLIATDDYYSKIVVYHKNGNDEELLEMPEDEPAVQEFLKIRENLSDKDREAIKKRFHKRVSPKGRFCTRCHATEQESYLPFRQLGFSERRIQDLTNLNIIGLVEKYKEFYMPNLLGSEKSLPSVEALTGTGKSNSTGIEELGTEDLRAKDLRPENIRKDPKAWWRQRYDTPTEKNPGK